VKELNGHAYPRGKVWDMKQKAISLAVLLFLVLWLAGCGKQENPVVSAQEILEQSAQAMEPVTGCTQTASLDMVMSVYGEATKITVDSRAKLSLKEEKADQEIEVRKGEEGVFRADNHYQGADELKAFTASLDVKRFLKNAEAFTLTEGDGSESIYELKGAIQADSLGRTQDLEAIASLLPVMDGNVWDFGKSGASFSVRLRVDKETFVLQDVTFNIGEGVQEALADSAESLGIPEEEIQVGGCIATIHLEGVEMAETDEGKEPQKSKG